MIKRAPTRSIDPLPFGSAIFNEPVNFDLTKSLSPA